MNLDERVCFMLQADDDGYIRMKLPDANGIERDMRSKDSIIWEEDKANEK